MSAPSPFLPGTNIQFAWDSTSLGYFKNCAWLYKTFMIDGWVTRDESIHLRFGIEYHKTLEDFDRFRAQGLNHEDALRRTIRGAIERTIGWDPDPSTKAGKYKNRWSLVRSCVGYIDKFRADAAKTHILANGAPAVELSFKFELDWGPLDHIQSSSEQRRFYVLSGHLDRVVRLGEDLYVMDRKTTTSALGSYYFTQFDMSGQMTQYTLAGQVVINSPIKGVIIDACQLALEKPDGFERRITHRTPARLTEWLADLKVWLDVARHYAEEDVWPRNEQSCDKYGGCVMLEVCKAAPHIRGAILKSKYIQLPKEERWNPLKPR